MLPSNNRLKKDKDFELVFKRGEAFNGKFLFLKIRKRNNLEVSRFGLVVGTKISKKATIRNKIKRRLRNVIRKRLGDIKPGFDVIIGAKTGMVDKSYQEIKEELEGLLEKTGVLKL
jgi:ribonuclease P protein component